MPAFKLATWACSRSQSRRNGVLGRAGKLDRNAGGDNAFEFHANLVVGLSRGGTKQETVLAC
jgi:hypothetical protein